MTITVALFGAGGKMGCRISEKCRHDPAYRMLYVEPGTPARSACASGA